MPNQEITPLVATAISWIYASRALLHTGYSGEDPSFSAARTAFLKSMSPAYPDKTEAELLQAFEAALNVV